MFLKFDCRNCSKNQVYFILQKAEAEKLKNNRFYRLQQAVFNAVMGETDVRCAAPWLEAVLLVGAVRGRTAPHLVNGLVVFSLVRGVVHKR